ncbi:unnamed protein product [Phaeothamnion confervicola]
MILRHAVAVMAGAATAAAFRLPVRASLHLKARVTTASRVRPRPGTILLRCSASSSSSSSSAASSAAGGSSPARAAMDEVDPGAVEGTDLRVLRYPHPALRAPNEPIDEFTPEVARLAREMFKVEQCSGSLLQFGFFGLGLVRPLSKSMEDYFIPAALIRVRRWVDGITLVVTGRPAPLGAWLPN